MIKIFLWSILDWLSFFQNLRLTFIFIGVGQDGNVGVFSVEFWAVLEFKILINFVELDVFIVVLNGLHKFINHFFYSLEL